MPDDSTSLRYATYVRRARQGSDLLLDESILVRHAVEWAGCEPLQRYREVAPRRMSIKMMEHILAEAVQYDLDMLVLASPLRLGRDRPWELVTRLQEAGIGVRFADGSGDKELRAAEVIDPWLHRAE